MLLNGRSLTYKVGGPFHGGVVLALAESGGDGVEKFEVCIEGDMRTALRAFSLPC